MTINLNDNKYDEKLFLTKENILKYVNEYSIFHYYVGSFTANSIMSSPFRKDPHPSFGIFYSKKFNCLLFKDLAQGISGDCFSLISRVIHPTFTRAEAMAQVVVDFGLEYKFVMPRAGFTRSTKDWTLYKVPDNEDFYKDIKPIGIKARAFNPRDYKFWAQFGIDREILRKYNVIPISFFTYGNNVFKADIYAYAYIEKKDGLTTYKIYQPYSEKIKFFTDMDASIHAGYAQLPATGETLIITKSLKDVMSIGAVTGFPAISVLSETILIKEKVIEEYKRRFKDVLVFFDNDEAGLKMAKDYREEFDLASIAVPKEYDLSKDFSDLVKQTNIETAGNVFENLVWMATIGAVQDDLPF